MIFDIIFHKPWNPDPGISPQSRRPHIFNIPRHILSVRVRTMARILVAYASKKGSTTEIAQAIGKELQAAGHVVDVTEVGAVTSPSGYNAIVIGGPMYMGKMMGEVGKFVKRHYNELKDLPVAGFIVGHWSGLKGTGLDYEC